MKFLVENLPLKIISLGLAVLLWYVIAGEKTSEMGVSVPVELQNFPRDLELTGDPTNEVEVRLRASPGIIQRLGPGDISARIDVTGAVEGERIVHLTGDSIRVPFGVQVVKVNPASITLNFERTQEKVVPIRPRLLGRPAAGYEVAESTTNPADVQVVGPKSRVHDMESAYTEPVSVEGARANVVERVHVGLDDPMLRIQGTPRAEVTVRIREVHETRTFAGLPIDVRNGEGQVRPAQVRVVLSGPASILAQIRPEEVKPYLEAAASRPGGLIPIAVELAPGHAGVTVKEWEPTHAALRSARSPR
jgi:YbbR domain-containing protein